MSDDGMVWGKRMKELRLAAGLSQTKLGVAIGLDPSVASTRINRYERGVHQPDLVAAKRIGEVLGVAPAYFYCEDDELATLVSLFGKLPAAERKRLLEVARSLLNVDSSSPLTPAS